MQIATARSRETEHQSARSHTGQGFSRLVRIHVVSVRSSLLLVLRVELQELFHRYLLRAGRERPADPLPVRLLVREPTGSGTGEPMVNSTGTRTTAYVWPSPFTNHSFPCATHGAGTSAGETHERDGVTMVIRSARFMRC